MINSEDWHRVLRLDIVGTVPMMIVALLEKCVVSGLNKGEVILLAILSINLIPFQNVVL